MYSNYNVLTLPIAADGKYQAGDIYKALDHHNSGMRKFDGLKIVNIDYCFGVRLHFDWNEWEKNKPKMRKKINKNSKNGGIF